MGVFNMNGGSYITRFAKITSAPGLFPMPAFDIKLSNHEGVMNKLGNHIGNLSISLLLSGFALNFVEIPTELDS
jgi:hypothetical protein